MQSRDITILIALAAVFYTYDCALLQLVSVPFYQSAIIPNLVPNLLCTNLFTFYQFMVNTCILHQNIVMMLHAPIL